MAGKEFDVTTIEVPRPDVPTPIAVIRDFVNTTDQETGTDDLATPDALADYLTNEGLLHPGPEAATEQELATALRLRAGLRQALEQNHADRVGPLPALSRELRGLPIVLDWGDRGPILRTTAVGVRGALAQIGLAVHDSAASDLWWRLKICAADDCAWAYYDHSKNRSRNWCEYGCGNKVKTRAYRARQRALQP
jgi:predicted RNA-binding Zn ribbon-like protein